MPVRKTKGGKCRKYGKTGKEYCGKDKSKAYTQAAAIKANQKSRRTQGRGR